jgi:16S rRNA (cytosine967-C5)-methyltransferase
MPISPARTAAFDILLQVEKQNAYASELLHSPRYERLSPADHGLATEIVMGVLRWRSSLDSEVSRFSSQKLGKLDTEVLTSLRMAAFQLLLLDRVPPRAAVHESVELVKRARKRSAVPFANALLRKMTGDKEGLDHVRESVAGQNISNPTALHQPLPLPPQDLQYLAGRYAHPWWLVERWHRAYGEERLRQILHSDQEIPATTIRLPNPADQAALQKSGVVLLSGALLKDAARIGSGDLTRTEPFRSGRISIQDEGSQLVALLVGHGARILDCCAAPGGKTRILSDRNPDAVILAAELHPHRARLLRRLVPAKNLRIITADARQLPVRQLFDRVLVDAPCSGTGTLSRNPEIKWRLKPEDLLDLQSKQLEILLSAMKSVAPQGRLVYSTCSLEPEENQEIVGKALAADTSFQIRDCLSELEILRDAGAIVWQDLHSLVNGPYLRTIPGAHPCDGFFAAVFEKK